MRPESLPQLSSAISQPEADAASWPLRAVVQPHALYGWQLLFIPLQRAYKEERQRWLLVSACLEHCKLCLESLHSGEKAGRKLLCDSASLTV